MEILRNGDMETWTWRHKHGDIETSHFMGAEILGFGLPNQFFGLTMSCFFRDGIVN
jgi:hypothetical protein